MSKIKDQAGIINEIKLQGGEFQAFEKIRRFSFFPELFDVLLVHNLTFSNNLLLTYNY